MVASIANAFLFLGHEQSLDTLAILNMVLQALSFLIALALTAQEHRKSRVSSTILLLFYPLHLILSVIRLRTSVISHQNRDFIFFVLNIAAPLLICIAYVVECLSPDIKDSAIQLDMLENIKESPLATANIYSRWTFGWITPLMKLGVSKYVTEDDLDNLLTGDTSAQLGHELNIAMKNQ